ncbi:unnamed protein product [Scytosiphon promiscuus]
MIPSRGCWLASLFLTVGAGHAGGGEIKPALPTRDTCNVCRGVTQGFVDLYTEWSSVRETEQTVFSRKHGRGAGDTPRQDFAAAITFEAAIEKQVVKFCEQSFLTGSQQRVCYSISPFAAEVGKWLRMGVSAERVCLKLGKRNPETCFDAREAELPLDSSQMLDWKMRPPMIPEDVDCTVEHRNSLAPRWVLLA